MQAAVMRASDAELHVHGPRMLSIASPFRLLIVVESCTALPVHLWAKVTLRSSDV